MTGNHAAIKGQTWLWRVGRPMWNIIIRRWAQQIRAETVCLSTLFEQESTRDVDRARVWRPEQMIVGPSRSATMHRHFRRRVEKMRFDLGVFAIVSAFRRRASTRNETESGIVKIWQIWYNSVIWTFESRFTVLSVFFVWLPVETLTDQKEMSEVEGGTRSNLDFGQNSFALGAFVHGQPLTRTTRIRLTLIFCFVFFRFLFFKILFFVFWVRDFRSKSNGLLLPNVNNRKAADVEKVFVKKSDKEEEEEEDEQEIGRERTAGQLLSAPYEARRREINSQINWRV